MMRALLQRVSSGAVSIEGQLTGSIGAGFVILVGVGKDDTTADVDYLVRKTVNLRVFADAQDKMNLSLKDIAGEALVVSQFTLYADTSRGNRPGFEPAAGPELARQLYQQYIDGLIKEGIRVATGTFAASMLVNIDNDGPVTIMLESPVKGGK